jgi:hypothetical protein
VLVLGGTGRVGGSTAAALSKLRPDLSILVKGRNRYPPYPTDHTSSAPPELSSVSIAAHTSTTSLIGGPFFAREKGEFFAARLGDKSEFVQVDTRDVSLLEKALQGQ